MKSILVAGGSGKLGGYLINRYKKDFNTISLSRKKSHNANESFNCDFLNKKNVKETLKIVKKKYGRLDAVIFTIGDSKRTVKDDTPNKFKTNFRTFKIFLQSIQEIYKNTPCKIIIISSIVTEKKIKDAPYEYVSSKEALKNYTRRQAKLLVKKKINLNLVSPGNILINGNNWSKRLLKERKNTINYLKKNVPISRFIDPEIIFNTCNLIINDVNNFYTGSNFIVDGGQSL